MTQRPPRCSRAAAGLPPIQPGRSAEAVAAERGLDSAIKLASNETPFGPLPGVAEAVAAAVAASHRYTDHTATAVRAAYADRIGVAPERIAAGPGASGILEQLAHAFADPGDEVLYPWPSFAAYPRLTQRTGSTARTVPLQRQRFDVDALVAAVDTRTRMLLICNPNNPTATALAVDELTRIVDAAPEECLVVIDEAYREFATDPAVPDALAAFGDRPNVAVVRTMSKAYAMAGLRVGFCIAHPDVIDAVNACATPFAVSATGQAAAVAAFAAAEEVDRRCRIVVDERRRVEGELRARGLGVPVSHANFWWLPTGGGASDVAAALEGEGVVTRPLGAGAEAGVRVTVGSPEENDRFLTALDAVVAADDRLLAGWDVAIGDAAKRAGEWLDRLDAVVARLRDHVGREHPGRTEPVPGEEETWDAGQVWAHLAEIGDYWLAELDKVLAAASDEPVPFGRTRRNPARIAAIETGRHDDPARHLAAVERSASRLSAQLSTMTNADWSRRGLHETLGVMDLDAQLGDFHVGHYEEHADQLDGIAR